ncbi:AAA domain-containing protein [Elizabethkingia argentiflava]|uniref:AAA domain-containing protein n=1 Tax=Elizabethkingia argenteiflava TaxID=2681556 RepID=A0A845PZM0_9FLAO|nr:sigma-54-dependent Fis family transcriptional regulator [Elizabethkingia argenteiflava]NAW52256.1 AAA domain-containing protein [Elizabethkingia argenteiflava]
MLNYYDGTNYEAVHPLPRLDYYHNVEAFIKKSWEMYVMTGNKNPGIRTLVSDSWERCRLRHSLVTGLQQAPVQLSYQRLRTLREKNGLLLKVAVPILKNLCLQFNIQGLIIALTDNDGAILHTEALTDTIRTFDRLNFSTGAIWSEAHCGTNAIGTALKSDAPVTIFSAEHYCEGWHHLVCTAVPIKDPYTQTALCVIDLTGHKELLGAHNFSVINATKTIIELSLEHEFRKCGTVYQVLEDNSKPIVIFNLEGEITRCNRLAQILFQIRVGMNFRIKFGLPPRGGSIDSMKTILPYTEDNKDWEIVITDHTLDHQILGGVAVFRSVCCRKIALKGHVKQEFLAFSSALKEVREMARRAAKFQFPVLITGRSGVGKERIAHFVHEQSPRKNQAFVPVNCGAISKDLIASELFGYLPGAFTGADPKGRKGKFVAADSGTLFLDEIAELPLDIQPYLLRILEEKKVYPLGADKAIPLNVRIITATNKNLEEEVAAGRFRVDLFYRLQVITLNIPDLKDRPEDILNLFQYFLQQQEEEHILVTPEAQQKLLAYPWPGNVRELKNAAEHAIFSLYSELQLLPKHLPIKIKEYEPMSFESPTDPENVSYSSILDKQQQLELIKSVIKQTGGNISRAATLLKLSRTTLYRKLRQGK